MLNTQVRSYQYPYNAEKKRSLIGFLKKTKLTVLSRTQQAVLLGCACCAIMLGAGVTNMWRGQIEQVGNMSAGVQANFASASNENIQLRAARAQLTSEERVVQMAGERLRLFTPAKGQIRRM